MIRACLIAMLLSLAACAASDPEAAPDVEPGLTITGGAEIGVSGRL